VSENSLLIDLLGSPLVAQVLRYDTLNENSVQMPPHDRAQSIPV